MSSAEDWGWKLREAVERLKTRYEHIGRNTAAPFLAIVYPPEAEAAVLKEWRTLAGTLGAEFDVRPIDVLEVTMAVVKELGADAVVATIANPMPGSNPETELGNLWVSAVVEAVKEKAKKSDSKKIVVVLENLSALYPVAGPRAVMQQLWDSQQSSLEGPVVVLIPGTLSDRRTYSFVNQSEEFMYRGDIL